MTNSFSLTLYTVPVQEVRKIYHIYIEYFFLINFVFLYSIWNLTTAVFSCSVTQRKLLKISFLGAVMICLFLFLPVTLWYRLCFGSISTLLISIRFLFPKRNGYKGYIKVIVSVLLSAIVLGGSIGLLQKWGWIQEVSMIKIMGLTLLISFGGRVFLKKVFLPKQRLVYPVCLIWDGMELNMLGLLDTGNGLIEPISKKPVCIVGKNVFEKAMEQADGKKEFQPEKFRAIPYHSVGKENGILNGFEMDYLIIDTDDGKVIIEKPVIGISDVPVSAGGSYEMILQPQLLREGEMQNDTESVTAR